MWRLGFAAVDQMRCRIQRKQTGHRGRTGDRLYRKAVSAT